MHEREHVQDLVLLEFHILDILLAEHTGVSLPEQEWLETTPNGWHIPVLRQDIRWILVTTDMVESSDPGSDRFSGAVVRESNMSLV